MGNISSVQVNILQLWIMTILYGIYIVIFAGSIYVLVFRPNSTVNKYLLFVTIALFTLSTAQNVAYFVSSFLSTDISASGYYSGETESVLKEKEIVDLVFCITDSLAATSNLIADGLLIWRCFMVWGRRFIVIVVPILLLTAGTVCGYIQVVLDVQLYLIRLHAPLSAPTPLSGSESKELLYYNLGTVFYATAFTTNVVMSLLIAGRIWWTTRESRRYFNQSHGKEYHRVVSIIIESGAVYSLFLLVLLIFVCLPFDNDNIAVAEDVIQAVVTQLVGMIPTLIIVLVALGRTSDQTSLGTKSVLQFNNQSASHSIAFAIPDTDSPGQMQVQGTVDLRVKEISRIDIEQRFSQKSNSCVPWQEDQAS